MKLFFCFLKQTLNSPIFASVASLGSVVFIGRWALTPPVDNPLAQILTAIWLVVALLIFIFSVLSLTKKGLDKIKKLQQNKAILLIKFFECWSILVLGSGVWLMFEKTFVYVLTHQLPITVWHKYLALGLLICLCGSYLAIMFGQLIKTHERLRRLKKAFWPWKILSAYVESYR